MESPKSIPTFVKQDHENFKGQNTEKLDLSDEWPGAFGIYKISKHVIEFNIKTFITLYVLYFIADVLESLAQKGFYLNNILGDIIGVIVAVLLIIVLFYLLVTILKTQLKSIRNKQVEFDINDVKSSGTKYALTLFLQDIVTGFLLLISILLFIIPFFFIFPRLILAPFLVIDKNLGVLDSIQESWRLTRGHVGKVYGIVGVFILMLIPSITIIGILASIYLFFIYSASLALLYVWVINQT